MIKALHSPLPSSQRGSIDWIDDGFDEGEERGSLSRVLAALLLSLGLTSCGGSGSVNVISPAGAQTSNPPIAPPATTVQAEWTQYRNAQVPVTLMSTDHGECWAPGRAFTASANLVYFGGMRPIILAHWMLVMTPHGGGARLVMFDDGPTNIEVIAEWRDQRDTPINVGAYVQPQLNSVIASGIQHKQIGLQVCGAAEVYLSTVQVVW